METIKIGSFNTKDNAINIKDGIPQDKQNHAEILANNIEKQNFDFLGTQELTVKYVGNISKELLTYKLYGNYRYGNGILTMIPYNENNNIITNKKVIFSKTVWLPWIAPTLKDFKESVIKASIMPRIATIVITEDEKHGQLCMINTHLDYQIKSLQIKQLVALKEIINEYSKEYPIILTGDFNMDYKNEYFKEFSSLVEKDNNIKRVEINEPTWYSKEKVGKTLDHIFIPKDWSIENAGIINDKDMEKISDHKEIFVEAKMNHK